MSRRRPALTAALLLTLTTSLACGGLMHEVQGDDLAELGARVAALPDTPERAQVLRMVEEAYIQVHQGQLGMFALTSFEVSVEDALGDDRLDSWELSGIRATAPRAPKQDTESRARLALRRRFAEQVAAATALGRTPVSSWTRPATLRAAIEQTGWTASDCSAYDDEWVREATCTVQRGAQYGYVAVTEFQDVEEARWAAEDVYHGATARDGRAVVSVEVNDGTSAASLRDVLLPPGSRMGVLTDQALAERIRAAGWSPSGCTHSRDPEGSWTSCAITQGKLQGSVDASTWRETGLGTLPFRSNEGGYAMAMQAGEQITVTVWDPDAAKTLLDALTTGPAEAPR